MTFEKAKANFELLFALSEQIINTDKKYQKRCLKDNKKYIRFFNRNKSRFEEILSSKEHLFQNENCKENQWLFDDWLEYKQLDYRPLPKHADFEIMFEHNTGTEHITTWWIYIHEVYVG